MNRGGQQFEGLDVVGAVVAGQGAGCNKSPAKTTCVSLWHEGAQGLQREWGQFAGYTEGFRTGGVRELCLASRDSKGTGGGGDAVRLRRSVFEGSTFGRELRWIRAPEGRGCYQGQGRSGREGKRTSPLDEGYELGPVTGRGWTAGDDGLENEVVHFYTSSHAKGSIHKI